MIGGPRRGYALGRGLGRMSFTAGGASTKSRWRQVSMKSGHPLVPDQWFSVFGKRGDHPAAAGQFVAAVADLHAVGQTFGGHVCWPWRVGRSMALRRFTLESYEIA